MHGGEPSTVLSIARAPRRVVLPLAGLLVGGPTVHVVTARRRWLLSTEEPQAVLSALGTCAPDDAPFLRSALSGT